MKLYATLAAVCLIIALSSGFFYFSYSRSVPSLNDISTLKSAFVKANQPEAVVDLTKIRLDPDVVLPRSFDFDYAEISNFSEAADSCQLGRVQVKDPRLKKALAWHRWNCGLSKLPPAEFFKTEPTVHPLGGTYVARSLTKMAGEPEWIKEMSAVLNAGELSALDPAFQSETQKFLSALTLSELEQLRDSELIVFSGAYVWYRQAEGEFTTKKYALFPTEKWNHFFADAPFSYVSRPSDDQPCVQFEGSGCWLRNERTQAAPVRFLILCLTLSVVGMALASAFLMRKWLRERRRDIEDRRFVLQMLTHELRTPATSLNLNIEAFRDGFDRLNGSQQDAFLRMCGDVQRLKNVIEASSAYLRVERRNGISLNVSEIPSINDWVERTLEEEGKPVRFTRLQKDVGMRADSYWLGLCLRNLIRNAYDHGTPPVTLTVEVVSNRIHFHVRDEGNSVLNLSEIVKPFEKQNRSRGLGIGLSIVQQLLRSMNGALEYRSSPTIFTIVLEKA